MEPNTTAGLLCSGSASEARLAKLGTFAPAPNTGVLLWPNIGALLLVLAPPNIGVGVLLLLAPPNRGVGVLLLLASPNRGVGVLLLPNIGVAVEVLAPNTGVELCPNRDLPPKTGVLLTAGFDVLFF